MHLAIEAPALVLREECAHELLVLLGFEAAGRVDERAAFADVSGGFAEEPSLESGQFGERPGPCRHRAAGRWASTPVLLQEHR